MTSLHRHICNPRRVCAKRDLRLKNFTFLSYLWQQYAIVSHPRPVSCESVFINLAQPIAALHHGKTAGLGERF